jgi:hypothetical protein
MSFLLLAYWLLLWWWERMAYISQEKLWVDKIGRKGRTWRKLICGLSMRTLLDFVSLKRRKCWLAQAALMCMFVFVLLKHSKNAR